MGAGAAWLDYDGDGRLDLYLVNGSTYDRQAGQGEPNQLFKGDGRGRFTDVTAASGAGDRGWGQGVAVGDYDNDGDPDLYITNLGPSVLLRNNGDGTFTDVTRRAGVGHDGWSTSAAYFDMEGDGDLDLYVCRYVAFDPRIVPQRGTKEAEITSCILRGIPVLCGPLGLSPAQDVLYRNNGDGTFTDATRAAGVWLDTPLYALGVVTGDYDNDGDQDVYVANDSVPNTLWRNRGNGTFEEVGMITLSALSGDGIPQAGMGTDLADFDDDGWLDIVVTNFSSDVNTLYHNVMGQYFLDESHSRGMSVTYSRLSWGTAFHDFDNDADQDLFIANGHVYANVDEYSIGTSYRQPNDLFVNAAGRFERAPAGGGLALERSFRGAAFADYDDDGDMDVLVTALDEPPLLMRNVTPTSGHRLQVRLVGSRSNRDGVGARVTLTAAGRTQLRERKGGGSYLSASEPRLHFGLGGATSAERVQVLWPSGRKQTIENVPADRVLVLREQDATGSVVGPVLPAPAVGQDQ
jgi:hypothetical protein